MIGSRRLQAVLAPVVILTTGACFATRNDVRILQEDLQTVRAERVAADSALAALLAQVSADLERIGARVEMLNDTTQATSASLMRLRGDLSSELRSIGQQLLMIQELTGQSQRRIQELRAEMEARAAQLATPPADSTGAPVAAASPGPAQLYQMGQDQLRRGSVTSARAAYEQLLTQYPTSDLAPQALYGVAETYADEGDGVQADSVYALVVQRYPRSEQAPNALYKRASAFRSIGQTEQAMAIYRQIVQQYPRSDAALLAQEFLRERP